jgi:hypothetical protein
MLKSLAIGLLTLTAAVSSAAFAGDHGPPPTPYQGDQGGLLCRILPWLCESHLHQGGGGGDGGVTAAPEFDPAGMMTAFTLLAGGLAVVRGRRAKR